MSNPARKHCLTFEVRFQIECEFDPNEVSQPLG